MKNLLILAFVCLLSITVYGQNRVAFPTAPKTKLFFDKDNIATISEAIGDTVVVVEKIYGGRYLSSSSLTLLNVVGDFPNQKLTLVIRGTDRDKFKYKPEEHLKGKLAVITGKLIDYNGKPQIVITNPDQIVVRPTE
jgi:hypothetical protein